MVPGSPESNEVAGVLTAHRQDRNRVQKWKEGCHVARCGKDAWREATLKVCHPEYLQAVQSHASP